MKRDLSRITPYLGFDVPTWLDHLRALNEKVFDDIKKTHENVEAWDRQPLEVWLKQCYPREHVVLRGMENAWQNCATTAFHQTIFLIETYDGAKMEPREEPPPMTEETPVMTHAVAEEPSKPPYRKKGEWNRHSFFSNFVLYRSKADAEKVLKDESYHTYYDVNGLWDMENLLSYFEREEIRAVGVKDKGIPAELEMLRFKVVTTEVYTPDNYSQKRVSKKKKL